jgi:hypothetical protein
MSSISRVRQLRLDRCVSHDLARFQLRSLAALPYIIPRQMSWLILSQHNITCRHRKYPTSSHYVGVHDREEEGEVQGEVQTMEEGLQHQHGNGTMSISSPPIQMLRSRASVPSPLGISMIPLLFTLSVAKALADCQLSIEVCNRYRNYLLVVNIS